MTNAVYLHTYLTYLRQTKTAERNLLMVESLKAAMGRGRAEEGKKLTKPQDLARLYDIIIQVRVETIMAQQNAPLRRTSPVSRIINIHVHLI